MSELLSLVAVMSSSVAEAPAAGFMGQFFSYSAVAAIGGVGLAAAGCGVAMGMCIAAALNGIARQPELTSKLQLNMIIGLAFIETLVLYTLFIAIILLFANPFLRYFVAGHGG